MSVVSPSVDGGASPRDTLDPLPATSAQASSATDLTSRTPGCAAACGCQSWDDAIHLIKCDAHKHAQLDPHIFTIPRGTDKCQHEDARGFFPHAIQNLPYQDLDQIQSRQQCMVCRMKGEFVQEFMRRTLSTQSPKFATSQPFVITQAELRVGESLTRVYPCLLPGAMLSNGNGAVSYTPVVLKLMLCYKGAGCSLDSVGTGTPTPIFLSNLAKWLDNCHEHHGDQCIISPKPVVSGDGGRQWLQTSPQRHHPPLPASTGQSSTPQ